MRGERACAQTTTNTQSIPSLTSSTLSQIPYICPILHRNHCLRLSVQQPLVLPHWQPYPAHLSRTMTVVAVAMLRRRAGRHPHFLSLHFTRQRTAGHRDIDHLSIVICRCNETDASRPTTRMHWQGGAATRRAPAVLPGELRVKAGYSKQEMQLVNSVKIDHAQEQRHIPSRRGGRPWHQSAPSWPLQASVHNFPN